MGGRERGKKKQKSWSLSLQTEMALAPILHLLTGGGNAATGVLVVNHGGLGIRVLYV